MSIEYSCDGEWVTASLDGYESRAPLDWCDEDDKAIIETACDEAREGLMWDIKSSRPEFDSQGERK